MKCEAAVGDAEEECDEINLTPVTVRAVADIPDVLHLQFICKFDQLIPMHFVTVLSATVAFVAGVG